MSVERGEGLVRFTCDGGPDRRGVVCRANYESDEQFAGAWREARALGWVHAEDGGTWLHYCKDCKRELGDD